ISLHPPRGGFVSRNNAMRPPVSAIKMFDYHSPADTDVIQEFFVPVPRFLSFMESAREVLRESQMNLLGLTIRYVRPDTESFISYAPCDEALAAVLYLNEPLSPEGWAKSNAPTKRLTRLATDMAGDCRARKASFFFRFEHARGSACDEAAGNQPFAVRAQIIPDS